MKKYSAIFKSTGKSKKFDLNLDLLERSEEIQLVSRKSRFNTVHEYIDCVNQNKIPLVVNAGIPEKIKYEILSTLIAEKTSDQLKSIPVHLLCTSGTTGTGSRPKTFSFSLKTSLANAEAHNQSLGLLGGEKVLFPLPMTHSFGVVIGILGSLCLNSETFLLESDEGVQKICDLLGETQFDVLYLTPSLARQLSQYLKRFDQKIISPRKISIGSSKLVYEDIKNLKTIFSDSEFYFTYGLTEMGPRVSTFKIVEIGEGPLPIGNPIVGVSWKVEGTLKIKSDYAALGLRDDFFDTHDIIDVRENEFFVRGRQDDVINYQGINIFPEEIENLFSERDIEAVVIGLSSKLHGEVPVVVSTSKLDRHKINSFLEENLPQTHLPKKFYVIDAFPKTEMGKINRKALKASFES